MTNMFVVANALLLICFYVVKLWGLKLVNSFLFSIISFSLWWSLI
jgi:hypothetical protein